MSDELHTHTFNDFNGAVSFIIFVYLVEDDDSAVMIYISDYPSLESLSRMKDDANFFLIELDKFAFRVERYTEFVTIIFVESAIKLSTGLSQSALDESKLTHMQFE